MGVWFSSTSGNTQQIAEYITEETGLAMEDIGDENGKFASSADSFIVGAPTWNTGADDRRSSTPWDDFLYDTLPNLDVAGKKVAVFGVGDQESYMDYYCDAVGELYDQFEKAGCKMYGATSTEGYNNEESKSERNGKFVGLLCDQDNQDDQSQDRVKAWVAQLKDEGFF